MISKNDLELQALKANLLLEVGCAGKVWDLPSCERIVTGVPCSRDPHVVSTSTTSACWWIHSSWSRVRRWERQRRVAAHTDTPPDSRGATVSNWSFRSSWLWERALPIIRHKKTASYIAWKGCQSQLTYLSHCSEFKTFFISTLVIFLPLYMMLLARPLFKAYWRISEESKPVSFSFGLSLHKISA